MSVLVGTPADSAAGADSTISKVAQSPDRGCSSVGRLQPAEEASTTEPASATVDLRMPRERSALAVKPDLLADDLVVETGLQVVLEAVGQGDDHVVHAPVLDQLAQQRARLRAVVLAQEVADHVQGEITGEVQYRVVEKVSDKLFHRSLQCQCSVSAASENQWRMDEQKEDGLAHIADACDA